MTDVQDGQWGDNSHPDNDEDWEGGNNTAKLFERSRIKALAGMFTIQYSDPYDRPPNL